MSDGRYQLVYETAKSRIEAQERDVDEMRSRTAAVFTLGIAITTFLGGFVLDRRSPGVLAIVGIILFGVVGILLGAVLWPTKWKFRLSARTLIDGWVEGDNPATPEELARELALQLDDNAVSNQTKLDRRWLAFQIALGALGAESIVWLVALSRQ